MGELAERTCTSTIRRPMIAFLKSTGREATLRAENDLLRAQLHATLRMLRERIGTRALPLTADERRLIAEHAAAVGWKHLSGTLLIVANWTEKSGRSAFLHWTMVAAPRKDGKFTMDDIVVEERLGGLLRHYRWKAAA